VSGKCKFSTLRNAEARENNTKIVFTQTGKINSHEADQVLDKGDTQKKDGKKRKKRKDRIAKQVNGTSEMTICR
jgi:hypothetical protein